MKFSSPGGCGYMVETRRSWIYVTRTWFQWRVSHEWLGRRVLGVHWLNIYIQIGIRADRED